MTSSEPARNLVPDHYARRAVFFWAGVLAVFLVAVWLLKSALLPFLLGAAIAYLLDPVVRRLAHWHVPRAAAALLILALFFLVLGALLAVTLPFAYKELRELIMAAPQYIAKLRGFAEERAGPLARHLGIDISALRGANGAPEAGAGDSNLPGAPMIGHALSFSGGVAAGLLSGGKAVAETLATFLLMPVVAFYMMNEWPDITGWIDGLIPRRHYDTIKMLLGRIDHKLAAFIRGQLLISLSLAVFYGIALTVAGVPYGFLIGIATGILAMIPYVSAPFGMASSAVFAWLNGAPWQHYAVLVGIFVAGNILESYVLTPRLMGKAVGMDPLWVLFAILAGGSLFGIVGMLLAVPIAASLGVLCAFAILRYRNSVYYGAAEAPAAVVQTSGDSTM